MGDCAAENTEGDGDMVMAALLVWEWWSCKCCMRLAAMVTGSRLGVEILGSGGAALVAVVLLAIVVVIVVVLAVLLETEALEALVVNLGGSLFPSSSLLAVSLPTALLGLMGGVPYL